VVLLLDRMPRPSYPTPSPSIRDMGGSFEPGLQLYSQPTPLSATFDPRQSRMSDPGYDPRQAGPPSASLHMLTARSPGLSSAYGASPNRPDYPITPRTYQAPRTEVHPSSRPPPQTAEYQLPPLPRIRSPPAGTSSQQLEQPHSQQQQQQQQQQAPPPPQPYQSREERSRIGIGGLLEPPGPPRSP
jgi:hypothetical protein